MGFEIGVQSQSSNARLRSASAVQADGSSRSREVTRVQAEARERVGGVGAPGVGRWGAEWPLRPATTRCCGAAAAGRRARRRSRECLRMPVAADDGEAYPARPGPEQQRARARRRVVRQRQRAQAHARGDSSASFGDVDLCWWCVLIVRGCAPISGVSSSGGGRHGRPGQSASP